MMRIRAVYTLRAELARGVLPLLVGATLVAGCAHDSAADRQFARLSDDVTKLTSERDALTGRASPGEPPVPTPTAAEPTFPARPPVEAVDTTPPSDDPEDGSPRPTIRVAGTSGLSRVRARRDEGLEVVTPAAGDAPRPSALDPEAKKAYAAALEKARAGRHRDGLAQMAAFLARWPDHPYADNAVYWQAECLAGLGESQKAITELEGLLARFPLGNKVPDALVKLSLLYERAGDTAKAQAARDRLEREFPKSDAARRRARNPSDGRPPRPKDPL